MNDLSVKIAIAEPSVILRSGLAAALKRIQGIHIQVFEISSIDLLANYIRLHKPGVLILNPAYWGIVDLHKLKEESGNKELKCFAFLSCLTDENILKQYDERISIYDSVDQLKDKLNKLFETPIEETTDDTEILSQREKEILTCVVKGQTNKEIAQTLFLSTHTVITHRRNIVRKLEIHSTAGLTIYAIVNKLVEIDEIKKDM
ncbi:MAG: response regulator transcription factor [Paludibacter sp.]|jgi:DNA-binding NarL/FixJ family response regulator|nr:response regulator transcription factor [Paludibacter sp.]MBP6356143.1 response regulator transcription factor [Paludibacter sp.]MBP6634532.1 response regulator transcription factor [Paludibacter sp.]